MPDFVYILWLPVAISLMAVAWVLTLGALGRPSAAGEEAGSASASLSKEM